MGFFLATSGTWGLILIAALFAPGLAGWALAAVTLGVFAIDVIAARAGAAREFPAADALLVGLGLAAPVLVAAVVWALAGGTGGVFLALAAIIWLGQVGHPAAHELIHAKRMLPRALGRTIYAMLGMGHHVSAHLRVHHAHVATPLDPMSAPLGMGFWAYAPRAWIGGFRAGWRAEARTQRRGAVHPYLVNAAVAGAALALAAMAGPGGLLALVILAAGFQLQVLQSDYVQHYGLRRHATATGFAPATAHHAWNSGHSGSSALMLNATRHSDHHITPGRRFDQLDLGAAMPRLPAPLPLMAALALVPPLWRRVMDPRARRYSSEP